MLVDARTDVLRWNRAYAALHPALVGAPAGERKTIWQLFVVPEGQHRIVNRDEQAPEVVAGFRYRYSQNVGGPRWQDFVTRLRTASPLFTRLWARHDVAPPHLCDKRYDIQGIREVSLRATGMGLAGHPGVRLVMHTSTDRRSRENIDRLLRRAIHLGRADRGTRYQIRADLHLGRPKSPATSSACDDSERHSEMIG